MTLHLSLLGPPSVAITDEEGARVAPIEPKRLALLAYLARPRPGLRHHRGEIVALFWPDLDESGARNALRQSLHYLRERLGNGFLAGSGHQRIGLDPGEVACDTARFVTALEQGRPAAALQAYGGEFLEGFSAADSVPLQRWVEAERARLRGAAVETALEVARDERERGDLEGSLHWARRGTEFAPYDERLVRAEIRLRAAMGEIAEATRVFRDFRDRVRADLDLEPSERTRELVESLQRDLPTRSMVAIRDSRLLSDRVHGEIRRSMDLVERLHETLRQGGD